MSNESSGGSAGVDGWRKTSKIYPAMLWRSSASLQSASCYESFVLTNELTGRTLSNWLQGDIPYFRDTYQTSAFLATQLALGSLRRVASLSSNESYAPDYYPKVFFDQLYSSRIFEIKRNGDILSFAWEPPLFKNIRHPDRKNIRDPEPYEERMERRGEILTSAIGGDHKEDRSIGNFKRPCGFGYRSGPCGNIHPADFDFSGNDDKNRDKIKPILLSSPKPVEKLYPTFTEISGFWLPRALIIGAFVALFACLRSGVPGKQLELGFISFSLMLVASACFFWEPLSKWLTSSGEGAYAYEIALTSKQELLASAFLSDTKARQSLRCLPSTMCRSRWQPGDRRLAEKNFAASEGLSYALKRPLVPGRSCRI